MMAAVFASSSTTTPFFPGLPGGIIAWIVCYKQRRSQIGGWLLLYFWQLYGGVLLTTFFFIGSFQSYVPESFDDPARYHLLLLTAVPVLVLYAVQIAVGTMLLTVRTWDMCRLLRGIMIAGVICDVIGIVIDSQRFPENVGLDLYSGIPSLIWTIYFFVSKRVQHVFRTHDWEVAVERIYPDPDKVSIGLL